MPRFVLLRHECPPDYEKPSHWDFMLEHEGVLRTWELRELPTPWAQALGIKQASTASAVRAMVLPNHRLEYLDLEGPLTDDRGSVRRCDDGEYCVLHLDEDRMDVRLSGAALRCRTELIRDGSEWHLSVGP